MYTSFIARYNADIQMWAESKVTWFGIQNHEDVEQIVTPDTEKPSYNTYGSYRRCPIVAKWTLPDALRSTSM